MRRIDSAIAAFFALLVAVYFWPVLFGGASLVPFDNLYRYSPWSAIRDQSGATQPYNELVSDLILENYAWKSFVSQSIKRGELPLWNPYLFAGVPFLAAGQNSTLYPFSILFYILPIERAYGFYIAIQLWIAALSMYWLLRTFQSNRFSATVAGITYAFSGFMLVSVAFPMMVSAAAWLPAIIACLERIFIMQGEAAHGKQAPTVRLIFWSLLTSIIVGLQFLAGHIEISLYILIVSALFTLWRTISLARTVGQKWLGVSVRVLLLTIACIGLGIGLASIQLVPLYELVQKSFRVGSQPYDTILGYAYPIRQAVTFLIPDFFGNPTHHSYLDLFDLKMHPARTGTIFWGIKNYVEAGSYIGILPTILAVVGVFASLKRLQPITHGMFFSSLAFVSLLFVFGTPFYAIVFYGLPGADQLHTPFRWVFPYTFAMATLAGLGANAISAKFNKGEGDTESHPVIDLRRLPWIVLFWSAVIIASLVATWLLRGPTIALVQRLLDTSKTAQGVFADGQMFYSYETRNVFLFAFFLLLSGVALRLLSSNKNRVFPSSPIPVGQVFAILAIVLDLFIVYFGFYPRADPKLAEQIPVSVEFLMNDRSEFRIASYDAPDEKIFNPNVGMLFGLSDIRGYDSIIPKQYVDFMRLIAPQDELIYNRIAPFYDYHALSSSLLNLLNVKYILSTRQVPNPGYTLVYDAETKIYRNENVLPRAFVVEKAHVVKDLDERNKALQTFDPREEVLLEEEPPIEPSPTIQGDPASVTIEKYTNNEVHIKVVSSADEWLVLTDSYFPGWRVFLNEQEGTIHRADGNFRAVRIPRGETLVKFKYAPISIRFGAVISLLAALLVALGLVTVAWQRLYRGGEMREQVHVVAKNSLIPIGTAAINQLLAFAFLPFLLRVLGPENNGRYSFAVTTWFILSTITDFGLGILVTREVSRDRSLANKYLTNTTVLRVLLLLASLPLLMAFLWVFLTYLNLSPDTAIAILLLWLGLVPSTIASALSYIFNAFEQFEFPNVVAVATALVSTALQVIVLLLGGGIIGLAAVTIVSNSFTLIVIYSIVRSRLFKPTWEWDPQLARWMFFESYPLMFNNLLSNLFFRIDVFILGPLKGDTVLGMYSTAYKFINALNIIPSNFTLALFPRFARQAANDKASMLRGYTFSLKLLLWTALPISVGVMFLARDVIAFFGGSDYLPDAQIALQWLIWFLPLSFINSLTHYVLIALNQQRFLTKAFLVGLAFNIAANLYLIPLLSYRGAALVTVLSELALLIPFYISLRRELAPVNFLALAWRPAIAAFAMGASIYWISQYTGLFFAAGVGFAIYIAFLFLLRAIGEDERVLFRRLLRRE